MFVNVLCHPCHLEVEVAKLGQLGFCDIKVFKKTSNSIFFKYSVFLFFITKSTISDKLQCTCKCFPSQKPHDSGVNHPHSDSDLCDQQTKHYK